MEELCKLLADKLGLAYDYVVANIPDIINRYAEYKISLNMAGTIVSIILIISAVIGLGCLINSYKKETSILWNCYHRMSSGGELVLTLSIIFFVIGVITMILCAINIIAWQNVPEIQIIKEVNMMLK